MHSTQHRQEVSGSRHTRYACEAARGIDRGAQSPAGVGCQVVRALSNTIVGARAAVDRLPGLVCKLHQALARLDVWGAANTTDSRS
jgi:hypothetical protein